MTATQTDKELALALREGERIWKETGETEDLIFAENAICDRLDLPLDWTEQGLTEEASTAIEGFVQTHLPRKRLRRYQVYTANAVDGRWLYIGHIEDWDITAKDAVAAKLWGDRAPTLTKVTGGHSNTYRLDGVPGPTTYYRAELVR